MLWIKSSCLIMVILRSFEFVFFFQTACRMIGNILAAVTRQDSTKAV